MRLIPIQERHDDDSKPELSRQADPPSANPRDPVPAATAVSTRGNGTIAKVVRPRGIARVPTHTVGHARERRSYARANLSLPLCVRSVAGRAETAMAALSTQDISSSGILFLCPRRIEPGTPIEMEVTLVNNPMGGSTVRMRTQACVVRAETSVTPGWHALAAAFDDITFVRDEFMPAV
jgi:PilZ domain